MRHKTRVSDTHCILFAHEIRICTLKLCTGKKALENESVLSHDDKKFLAEISDSEKKKITTNFEPKFLFHYNAIQVHLFIAYQRVRIQTSINPSNF